MPALPDLSGRARRIRLIDARSTLITDDAEDKNVARAKLIDDCQIVYVQSIGGPAAAKAVRANIHPVKVPEGGKARVTLQRLQAVLDAPPPWLAKILGVEAKSLSRFSRGGRRVIDDRCRDIGADRQHGRRNGRAERSRHWLR